MGLRLKNRTVGARREKKNRWIGTDKILITDLSYFFVDFLVSSLAYQILVFYTIGRSRELEEKER